MLMLVLTCTMAILCTVVAGYDSMRKRSVSRGGSFLVLMGQFVILIPTIYCLYKGQYNFWLTTAMGSLEAISCMIFAAVYVYTRIKNPIK